MSMVGLKQALPIFIYSDYSNCVCYYFFIIVINYTIMKINYYEVGFAIIL